MIHVHDHASRLGIAGLKNPVEKKLQVVQRLLPASDKTVRLVGENLQHLMPIALLLFDLENKAEIAQHGIENFTWRKITAHGAARFFLFPGGGRFPFGDDALFFQRGQRFIPRQIELDDGEKILRCPIKRKSARIVVAEDQENDGMK